MGQWAFSMENVLGLNLPWRSLSSHLVTTDKDGNIDYMSTFQDLHIQKPVKEASETQFWLKPGWSQTPFVQLMRVPLSFEKLVVASSGAWAWQS